MMSLVAGGRVVMSFFWAFLNGLLAIEKCPELIITEVDIEGN